MSPARRAPPHSRTSPLGFWCVVFCCCVLVVGCVPPKVTVQTAPRFDASSISSLAVLPFQVVKTPQIESRPVHENLNDPEEIRRQFQLPGTNQMVLREPRDVYVVPESAARHITSKVVSILLTRPSLQVIGPPETAALLTEDHQKAPATLKDLAQQAGKQFEVDGVLVGIVSSFREREGSKLGAKPAVVGFEIYLLRPSDGVALWRGEFFEEQKPLTEDVVGFFEKGGGFVTANTLADLGVNKVMEKFPVGVRQTGPPLPPTSLSGSP